MNRKSEMLEWSVNIEALYKNFKNIPHFDESLRFYKDKAYFLMGKNSINYDFE